MRSRILGSLVESDVSSFIQRHIERKGLKVVTGSEVDEIGGNESVGYVRVSGETIRVSMVIFAVGVQPNTGLAENVGIKLGRYGIQVDEYMRTSELDIYAAGLSIIRLGRSRFIKSGD